MKASSQTTAYQEAVVPSPTRSASIELAGVNKEFTLRRSNTVQALQDVDLKVEAGEFVALFGPSGCGKSTLLRVMAGLETVTSGNVTIGGTTPAAMLAEHRLGFAFQEHALLPWATVEDNIALPYQLARRRVDSAKVRELIELVGLDGFEKARPKQLSGGMRQRVAIARALALSPDLLLLDEPFGALDEITRRRLNFELTRIWEETGVTTVLVTHSVDEALLLSDRVVVMTARPGRIAEEVTVDLPRPRDEETFSDPRFGQLSAHLIRLLNHDSEKDRSR
jgi:NitT/TauT family transport system ATP-binding protein